MAATGRAGQPTSRVAPWSRFEEAALDESVRRRLFTGDRAMVIWCSVTCDAFPADHDHPVDQVVTVMSGRAEVRLDGRLVRLAPGQAVRVDAGLPHSIRRFGPLDAETLNIFSPTG